MHVAILSFIFLLAGCIPQAPPVNPYHNSTTASLSVNQFAWERLVAAELGPCNGTANEVQRLQWRATLTADGTIVQINLRGDYISAAADCVAKRLIGHMLPVQSRVQLQP